MTAWRRQDWGFAAATAAGAVLVAYLVAGNFGLVPSPLTAAGAVRVEPTPRVQPVRVDEPPPVVEPVVLVPAPGVAASAPAENPSPAPAQQQPTVEQPPPGEESVLGRLPSPSVPPAPVQTPPPSGGGLLGFLVGTVTGLL